LDELKMLQELFVHYQSKAFQVIAINVEDQTISNDQVQLIADYCNEIGVTFPVLIDQGLQQFNHYTIKAVPTTFLINHKRTIIEKLAGYPISRRNQLTTTIKDIIQPASEKGTPEEKHFTRAEEKAQRYYQMAKVLRKKKDLSSAAVSLRKSIALDDDFFAAYSLLAITLYEDGKGEEAVRIFNEIASKNSNDPLLQLDYGNFLIQIGDAEKGLTVIRQVLKEDKNYARAHYYLGEYLLKQEKQDEALKEAQTAVELNPLDYDSQRLLGDIYALQDKKDLSLATYKKAATLLEYKVKGNNLILSLCY
jgi:Tfp pilus assembly protein PilF